MSRQKLHVRPKAARGLTARTLGRAAWEPAKPNDRPDCFLLVRRGCRPWTKTDLDGHAGILVEAGAEDAVTPQTSSPLVTGYQELGHIAPDSVIAVNPGSGSTHILYRPESSNNSLFATVRCNSNCLMCSQPPALGDDNSIVTEHLRLIDLVTVPPPTLGITGGEPTLLGSGLVDILARLKQRFPATHVQMLTNGRLYAYEDLVAELAAVGHPSFLSAIPLYADIASEHDYIVQARGAFDQTIRGLYNAARYGLQIEIRVVLHKQTIPRLVKLCDFIYRNLPFVSHVALMGLENMGYVKKNWQTLWIDPLDYGQQLETAARHLFYRGIPLSIYNLQLCVLPKALWPFARRSISDYKNIYLPECEACTVRDYCGGLFASSETRHSRGIRTISSPPEALAEIFQPTCSV